MANTTFANLKINALRRAGNNYSGSDATLLSIAGSLINESLGTIQSLIKGHPFTLDIGNTVSTVASQAYVDLVAVTDILEIFKVYQRPTNRALTQITYAQYIEAIPDPTRFGGTPDIAWAPTQVVTTGNVNWFIYLLPTPSSVITLYYDYMKAFSLSADADYSPLPPSYDGWIYAEFKPLLYEIIDSKNRTLIQDARDDAKEARDFYMKAIMSQASRYEQVASKRGQSFEHSQVRLTPHP